MKVSGSDHPRWSGGKLARRANLMKRRQVAREFVAAVRATTVCKKCGKQPIEWHREEHVATPSRRINQMAGWGAPIDSIKAEILRCEALCRRCHMEEDGRLEASAARIRLMHPDNAGDKHWTRRK
jgi:hypothetical protein